jgi:predicted PurR-regulated permease PerM
MGVELRGFVAASIIVFVALAAVSEIVLPLTFAAVLAVIFKPLVRILERHKVWPALAAGIVVLGLLALVTGVVIATVRGVTQQADQISGVADKALHKAADLTDAVGVDQSSLDALRKAIDDAAPMITTGVLAGLVSGIGTGSPHLCDAGGVCSADNRLDRTLAKADCSPLFGRSAGIGVGQAGSALVVRAPEGATI